MARKPRNLSAEEKALWSDVAATTNRLNNPVFEPVLPKKVAKAVKPKTPKESMPDFKIGQLVTPPTRTGVRLAPKVAERIANQPLTMDKKVFKKLSRGRMKPDARIDLHGMTLAQAQPSLAGFVLSAHSSGHRLVLVITGKGRTQRESTGPIPERNGVLRDQVPRWLSMEPLRSIVLQVSQAHQSHGGGGAYYVYLRRGRK